jgi:hypothetical protein
VRSRTTFLALAVAIAGFLTRFFAAGLRFFAGFLFLHDLSNKKTTLLFYNENSGD